MITRERVSIGMFWLSYEHHGMAGGKLASLKGEGYSLFLLSIGEEIKFSMTCLYHGQSPKL